MRHLLIATLAVLAGAPAVAAPITITDATDDIAYSTDTGAPTGYFSGLSRGDFIGNGFDTSSITLNYAPAGAGDVAVDLKLNTQFNGDDQLGYTTRYADLFLRTPSTGVPGGAFNYALALGDQTGNGGVATAGLYADPTYKTSLQVWNGRSGYIFGGEFVQSGASVSTAAPIPTVVTGGELLQDATVTQSGGPGAYAVDVTFTLTDTVAAAFAGGFDLLWGTGDCGNDAVFGAVSGSLPCDVPEPGTLALVGAGALGLLALRRGRFATQS